MDQHESRTDPGPRDEAVGSSGPGPPGAALARQAVDPQKLIRIASVTREVLEEARRIKPEPAALDHLSRVHERIRKELQDSLPPELYEELRELTPEIRSGSLEELALGHAEILGWLEGLFQGTQVALQIQAARAFTERAGRPRGAELPPGDQTDRERDPRYL